MVANFSLLRRGIVATLLMEPWLKLCGETGEAPRARQLCTEQQPALAVVDLELENGDGLALMRELARLRPDIGVMALSDREEPEWVQRMFSAGATGFISKRDAEHELTAGLWRIYNGDRYLGHSITAAFATKLTCGGRGEIAMNALSDREMTVLRCVAAGQGPRKIAERLKVAVTTVETHLQRIKVKLSLRNSAELKRVATRWALSRAAPCWLVDWLPLAGA